MHIGISSCQDAADKCPLPNTDSKAYLEFSVCFHECLLDFKNPIGPCGRELHVGCVCYLLNHGNRTIIHDERGNIGLLDSPRPCS